MSIEYWYGDSTIRSERIMFEFSSDCVRYSIRHQDTPLHVQCEDLKTYGDICDRACNNPYAYIQNRGWQNIRQHKPAVTMPQKITEKLLSLTTNTT